jgi:hypothetical protein
MLIIDKRKRVIFRGDSKDGTRHGAWPGRVAGRLAQDDATRPQQGYRGVHDCGVGEARYYLRAGQDARMVLLHWQRGAPGPFGQEPGNDAWRYAGLQARQRGKRDGATFLGRGATQAQ